MLIWDVKFLIFAALLGACLHSLGASASDSSHARSSAVQAHANSTSSATKAQQLRHSRTNTAKSSAASDVGSMADEGDMQLAVAAAHPLKRYATHSASVFTNGKHSRRSRTRSRDNPALLENNPTATGDSINNQAGLPAVPKFAQGSAQPEVPAAPAKGQRPGPAASYVHGKHQHSMTGPLLPAGRKKRHHESRTELPQQQLSDTTGAQQPTGDAPHGNKDEEEKEAATHKKQQASLTADAVDQPQSEGHIHDASAELQISHTGDDKGTGTVELDGGLVWTVTADSGRSSSLSKLQADGSYGAWSLQVTHVYKWARVPGVRPFFSLEGSSSQPTSVTIKGKLGGSVPGPKHQTQLTSAVTTTSSGRVPRTFLDSARVYVDKPHTCSYKWTSSESDKSVECRGELTTATPTLAFDGTLREFLDAGLHQDLPFGEHVHVTCQIDVCTPSDEV